MCVTGRARLPRASVFQPACRNEQRLEGHARQKTDDDRQTSQSALSREPVPRGTPTRRPGADTHRHARDNQDGNL